MPFPRASNAVLLAASLDLASSSSSPLARLVSPEQFVAPPVLLRDLTVCGMMDRFKEERAELAKLLEKILLELLGEVIKPTPTPKTTSAIQQFELIVWPEFLQKYRAKVKAFRRRLKVKVDDESRKVEAMTTDNGGSGEQEDGDGGGAAARAGSAKANEKNPPVVGGSTSLQAPTHTAGLQDSAAELAASIPSASGKKEQAARAPRASKSRARSTAASTFGGSRVQLPDPNSHLPVHDPSVKGELGVYARSVLTQWFCDHILDPYPSDARKADLARQARVSYDQVSAWFINSRMRKWNALLKDVQSGRILQTPGSESHRVPKTLITKEALPGREEDRDAEDGAKWRRMKKGDMAVKKNAPKNATAASAAASGRGPRAAADDGDSTASDEEYPGGANALHRRSTNGAAGPARISARPRRASLKAQQAKATAAVMTESDEEEEPEEEEPSDDDGEENASENEFDDANDDQGNDDDDGDDGGSGFDEGVDAEDGSYHLNDSHFQPPHDPEPMPAPEEHPSLLMSGTGHAADMHLFAPGGSNLAPFSLSGSMDLLGSGASGGGGYHVGGLHSNYGLVDSSSFSSAMAGSSGGGGGLNMSGHLPSSIFHTAAAASSSSSSTSSLPQRLSSLTMSNIFQTPTRLLASSLHLAHPNSHHTHAHGHPSASASALADDPMLSTTMSGSGGFGGSLSGTGGGASFWSRPPTSMGTHSPRREVSTLIGGGGGGSSGAHDSMGDSTNLFGLSMNSLGGGLGGSGSGSWNPSAMSTSLSGNPFHPASSSSAAAGPPPPLSSSSSSNGPTMSGHGGSFGGSLHFHSFSEALKTVASPPRGAKAAPAVGTPSKRA